MAAKLVFSPRVFPSRIADLGFAVQLPADWIVQELPADQPDFSNPTQMFPLAVVTAPHATIFFAFGARPAFDDGTLHDWAWYLLQNNNLKPRAIGPHPVGILPAIVGEATQETELGTMVVRFAFFEDGKRLVNLVLTAPELFADSVRDAWFKAIESFALETPRGVTAPLQNPAAPAAPANEPNSTAGKPETSAESAPAAEEVSAPDVEAAAPAATGGANTFAAYALENDTTSLDQETSINANLRDRGIGLVPHVVKVDEDDRRATVAAGAIVACFDVPYGWHVIDDGKRTLIFEPEGKVQINLNLIPRECRDAGGVLDALEAETRSSYPSPEFVRLGEGRIRTLGVRNIQDGGEALEQYHLIVPARDEQTVLRARVTATPERSTSACNLAQLILESVNFDIERDEFTSLSAESAAPASNEKPTQAPGELPAWWQRAVALEAANNLKEAEQTITRAVDHIGAAASVAEMYRLRMLRLKKAGDRAGAKEAFKQAHEWIFFHASQATSGGEGAALSLERDEFRARLVSEYGGDPLA